MFMLELYQNAERLSRATLSIMTPRIMLQYDRTVLYKVPLNLYAKSTILSVVMNNFNAQCCYAECYYVIILGVIMLQC